MLVWAILRVLLLALSKLSVGFLASASEVTVPCLKVCRFGSGIMENYKIGGEKTKNFRALSFVLVYVESIAEH